MLPISKNVYTAYNYSASPRFRGSDVTDIVAKGDKALNENKFREAFDYYQEASTKNPEEIEIYRKLGKASYHLKDYKTAAGYYQKFLEKNPDDVSCLIELGENQRQQGLYQQAIMYFEKANSIDENNDLAKRSIMTAKNNMLSIFAPDRAYEDRMDYARSNLENALTMAVNYLGVDFMSKLQNVNIRFGKTATMGGTANIAQYENAKNAITISDTYTYASPQLIAAYLVHESIHAHDNDSYTSIREEQDAYEVATKFWVKNSNGVKDPEMDYAAGLYKQSPATLKNRVAEIYTLRDPDIAQTSPNHPPKKLFHKNKASKAASQGIKTYNIIA